MKETIVINTRNLQLPPETDIPDAAATGRLEKADPNQISIFFDGSCTPNPGPNVRFGVVAFDGDECIFEAGYDTEQAGHNGVGEMLGLNRALDLAEAFKAAQWAHGKKIVIMGDGQNCINGINLVWKFSAEPEKTLLAAALAKRERLEPGVTAKLKAGNPVEIPVVKIPDADNRAHNMAKG